MLISSNYDKKQEILTETVKVKPKKNSIERPKVKTKRNLLTKKSLFITPMNLLKPPLMNFMSPPFQQLQFFPISSHSPASSNQPSYYSFSINNKPSCLSNYLPLMSSSPPSPSYSHFYQSYSMLFNKNKLSS